ncbi:MAG TPA: toxin-antitoxin system HicB family antitoxin [Anaerolineae bacterium]|nr:toxin-antitoxin system HicB family antitoxin [Anaerolineae bacterium]
MRLIQSADSARLREERGDAIPEPCSLDAYSGRFVLRMPRSLHRDLVEVAEREGTSLNQFINVVLARAVGQRDCQKGSSHENP